MSTSSTVKSARPAWVPRLLAWFRAHRRAMPWREHPAPYAVWVSEVMLQQTQVETVRPYFERFMARFPSIRVLADADRQQVLKVWEGLGYYSRARNLHKAARVVVAKHAGCLPEGVSELLDLPGIGCYTAAAIASICHGQPYPVVDGNVRRVLARFRGMEQDVAGEPARRDMENWLKRAIPISAPGDFNQGLMELGALICRPRNPKCQACPIRRGCVARRIGATDRLPVRSRRPPDPHYHIAAAAVIKGGKVLISRRRESQMLGGMWEFPGGKQELGETLEEAVRRELLEETSLNVHVGDLICAVDHAYSHLRITLHVFACRALSGRALPLASDAVKWVPLDRLREYPFPAADVKVIDRLEEDGFSRLRAASRLGRTG